MPKVPTKCSVSKLKGGHKLSRLSYVTVVDNFGSSVLVRNEQGVEWSIGASIVEAECFSAHEFSKTETMTRTELVAKFNEVGRSVYTVNFNKQPKLEDAFDAIANRGEIKSNKELKKLLTESMKGEPRTLVGYTVSRDVSLGRSMVVDLEQTGDDRIRQVDPRSLNWVICEGVRYEVKGK
jgi:hypothetical protein